MGFKVYKKPCKNCLLSDDAIVSPERRSYIISNCTRKQTDFTCHVASIEGEDVCCHNFYKQHGHVSQLARIAERLGAVEMVDLPEKERLASHRETQSK